MANKMTQIKFTIDSDIVQLFKDRCASEGISMTSVIRKFMKDCKPTKDNKLKSQTRPQRKKAVLKIISSLETILQMEESYRDNIPEVFENRFEVSDHTCEKLSEAISSLEEAF